jgi:3',5'-nucleoside bisphosphate phosphatase
VIDLHSHTIASDGYLDAKTLVREAWSAGIRTLAVTDHDTVAAIGPARDAAVAFGLTLVTGIEITAIDAGRDIHVLGYFFDPDAPALARCLAAQRDARRTRLRAMAERLAECGVAVSIEELLANTPPERALGRPALAEALVAEGHARSRRDAFDTWIGEGCPAWVPRQGPSVREAVGVLHDAGGLASVAHPVLYGRDDEIARWRDEGLDAIEAYHSEHEPADVERYCALAGRLGMLVTGGSDYHGEHPARTTRSRPRVLGSVSLPADAFGKLLDARRKPESQKP